MESLKRKRRRLGGNNFPVNQLFIKWIEELRDDARERGVKSQYAYSKAVNSLKKYPLPLTNGDEAKILDHIGDKLAAILSKKLLEHEAQQEAMADGDPPPRPPHSTKKAKAKKKVSSPLKRPNSPLADSAPKSKRRSVREYVPQYRSGPYSILISLFEAQQSESWRGYLKKPEVIEQSQPHCDTSFTISSDGSYYNAWSSMTTVIKKGYVSKWSNPAKFCLTEPGVDMALKLLTGNFATAQTAQTVSPKIAIKQPKAPDHHPAPIATVIDITDTPPLSPASTATDVTEPYSIDEDIDIKVPTHSRDTITTSSTSNTNPPPIPFSLRSSTDVFDLTCDSDDDDGDLPVIVLPSSTCGHSSKSSLPKLVEQRDRRKGKYVTKVVAPKPNETPSVMRKKVEKPAVSGASVIERSSVPGPSTANTQSSVDLDLTPPNFVLRPGDFEVLLCVDNAESTASRKSSSQFRGILLQDLAKNGVIFDVRKLSVGDFMWIAREKVAPLPGQLVLPETQEAVLEYIVERKRMDDLAGSILDGRFPEQKFRMKNCGVRNPIYLVEEYGDTLHIKLPVRSLQQAITNTQILDGFYVKRTHDIRESVAYLTIMTRHLQQFYANKTIKVYPVETLVNKPKPAKSKSTVLSMPFKQFNQASIKNKTLSVYETFARHLIQLPYFSGDKAMAILQYYPTVQHLREAYQSCTSDKERQKLCADIKAGQCNRRLGDKAGKLLCSLYWKGN